MIALMLAASAMSIPCPTVKETMEFIHDQKFKVLASGISEDGKKYIVIYRGKRPDTPAELVVSQYTNDGRLCDVADMLRNVIVH